MQQFEEFITAPSGADTHILAALQEQAATNTEDSRTKQAHARTPSSQMQALQKPMQVTARTTHPESYQQTVDGAAVNTHVDHAYRQPSMTENATCVYPIEELDVLTPYRVRSNYSTCFNSDLGAQGSCSRDAIRNESLFGDYTSYALAQQLGITSEFLQNPQQQRPVNSSAHHHHIAAVSRKRLSSCSAENAAELDRSQQITAPRVCSSVQLNGKQSSLSASDRASLVSDPESSETPIAVLESVMEDSVMEDSVLEQRYSTNLSAFSNQWHTGLGGNTSGSPSELDASSSYLPCSTRMSLRGSTPLVPAAPRAPVATQSARVAAGEAQVPCMHAATPSITLSVHDREACSSGGFTIAQRTQRCTQQQPCMHEGCERCSQLRRPSCRAGSGVSHVREVMVNLQSAVKIGAFVEEQVLPVHKFLAPVKTKCKPFPPKASVTPVHYVHCYPADEPLALPQTHALPHPSHLHRDPSESSLFQDDATSVPLSSFPSFQERQSSPMTPTHELTRSQPIPVQLQQCLPSTGMRHPQAVVQAATRFRGCFPLPLTPPTLTDVYNSDSLDVADYNATESIPYRNTDANKESTPTQIFLHTHHNPFFQLDNASHEAPVATPPATSASQKLKGQSCNKHPSSHVASLSAFGASPAVSASETQMGPTHGVPISCTAPVQRTCITTSSAAENAAHVSWRQNSKRHEFAPDQQKPKRHESPQRNVFCPPDIWDDSSSFDATVAAPCAPVDTYSVSATERGSRSSGSRTGGLTGGLWGGRKGKSSKRNAADTAGSSKRIGKQFWAGIRNTIKHLKPGASAPLATIARKKQKNALNVPEASSRSFRVSQRSASDTHGGHASGISPPGVVNMHGDASAKSQTKQTQRNSKSLSASTGLSLWLKSMRGTGIQRWRTHEEDAHAQSRCRSAPMGAGVPELKSADTSHDAEEFSHGKRRSFHSSKGATENVSQQNGQTMHTIHDFPEACMQQMHDCMNTMPDDFRPTTQAAAVSQHAARTPQFSACSFQHAAGVPTAPPTPCNLTLQERSGGMHAHHAQRAEIAGSRGVADRGKSLDGGALSIGSHSAQHAARGRANRTSLDIGTPSKTMVGQRMHVNSSMHVGYPVVDGKNSFGRRNFEVGKSRRMHANFRACVFPLHESDTESSSLI